MAEPEKSHEQRMEEARQEKAQQFDDLLSGKSAQEKNLQQIFRESMGAVKETIGKEGVGKYVNSAKSSLGSMSELLERRR